MDQDRTWNLFALKLAGKASPEEWAELQLLIENSPEIKIHLQALTNFWHQHSRYDRERIEKAVKKIAENYAGQPAVPAGQVKITNQIMQESKPGSVEKVYQPGIIDVVKTWVKFILTGPIKKNRQT